MNKLQLCTFIFAVLSQFAQFQLFWSALFYLVQAVFTGPLICLFLTIYITRAISTMSVPFQLLYTTLLHLQIYNILTGSIYSRVSSFFFVQAIGNISTFSPKSVLYITNYCSACDTEVQQATQV